MPEIPDFHRFRVICLLTLRIHYSLIDSFHLILSLTLCLHVSVNVSEFGMHACKCCFLGDIMYFGEKLVKIVPQKSILYGGTTA